MTDFGIRKANFEMSHEIGLSSCFCTVRAWGWRWTFWFLTFFRKHFDFWYLFKFFFKIDSFWKILLIFDTFSESFAKLTVYEKIFIFFDTFGKFANLGNFHFWHILGILANFVNFHYFDIFWNFINFMN